MRNPHPPTVNSANRAPRGPMCDGYPSLSSPAAPSSPCKTASGRDHGNERPPRGSHAAASPPHLVVRCGWEWDCGREHFAGIFVGWGLPPPPLDRLVLVGLLLVLRLRCEVRFNRVCWVVSSDFNRVCWAVSSSFNRIRWAGPVVTVSARIQNNSVVSNVMKWISEQLNTF